MDISPEVAQLGAVGILALTILAMVWGLVKVIPLLANSLNKLADRIDESNKAQAQTNEVQSRMIQRLDANTVTVEESKRATAEQVKEQTRLLATLAAAVEGLTKQQTTMTGKLDPLLTQTGEIVSSTSKLHDEVREANMLTRTAMEVVKSALERWETLEAKLTEQNDPQSTPTESPPLQLLTDAPGNGNLLPDQKREE